jgi:hypothetical protein
MKVLGSRGRLRVSLHGPIHESPETSGRVLDWLGGVPCFNVGQEATRLHALLFDADDILASARVVMVGPDGQTQMQAVSS